jgi:hypothetical protein
MLLIYAIVLSALLWGLPERLQVSTPSPPSKHSSHPASTTDLGSIHDGAYRNPYFGVSYKIPVGWVDRTKDMQPGNGPGKGLVLLAIFERPPEALGEAVNSAVVIAAEPVASYSGLKTAADYFEPLTELATGKGFKVVNQPYEFSIGSKALVRADFTKALGQQAMHQASVAQMEKGYFVSFTFIGGSEDEVEELIGRLSLKGGAPSGERTRAR